MLLIVFKPGPVQGPVSRFWSSHRIRRSILILKKIQKGVVLVKKKNKKKSQRVATGFFRACRVTPGHDFSYFLSTRPGFNPGSICQARPGFKTILLLSMVSPVKKNNWFCMGPYVHGFASVLNVWAWNMRRGT